MDLNQASTATVTEGQRFQADLVNVQYIEGQNTRYAYRRFGRGRGVPLVMAVRFGATIDHWDPALLDALNSERDVIAFDSRGVGRSSGNPPTTIGGLAEGLLDFVDALGLTEVDLLGWSIGGYVVQAATLLRPALVRRLVVAASGAGRVPDMPPLPDRVVRILGKPDTSDEDILYLFFPHTDAGRRAGRASLRRLDARLSDDSHIAVSPEALDGQRAALAAFGADVWDRLDELTLPVLVANGTRDVMIDTHAYASNKASQRLPNAKLILYSDAGHAFLFQYANDFGQEVLNFLR